jgi:hypothetical protein
MVAVIHPLLCTSAFQKTGLGVNGSLFTPEVEKRRQGTHREKRGICCFIGLSINALGDHIDRECQHGQEAQSIVKTST